MNPSRFLTITELDAYRDGGTYSIETVEHGLLCVDRRIQTATRGHVYLGYPKNGELAGPELVAELRAALVAYELSSQPRPPYAQPADILDSMTTEDRS